VNKTLRGLLVLIGIVVFTAVVCVWLPFAFLPSQGTGMALPVISVPGEVLWKDFPFEGFDLTNTMVGTLVTSLILLLILLWLRTRSGGIKAVPGRLQSVLELVSEYWYNLSKSIAGARAGRVFPLVMTIFMFLLIANWIKLVPGAESVGLLHCAHPGLNGYPAVQIAEIGQTPVERLDVTGPLDAGTAATLPDFCACELEHFGHIPDEYAAECAEAGFVNPEHADEGEGEASAEGEGTAHAEGESEGETGAATPGGANPNLLVVTPFVRGATTDLNLTVALALFAVVAIQVFGVWAQGPNYFQKFINLDALGNLGKKPLGLIDFLVGLLEIVSEFAKIISFAFRLFGNLFAGSVLLFIISFLLALIVPMVIYGLELFVGLMQAFVFAVLTLVFSAQAMAGHHGDDEHH